MSKVTSIASLLSPPEQTPLEFSMTTSVKSSAPTHLLGPSPMPTSDMTSKAQTPEKSSRVLPSPPISPWMEKGDQKGTGCRDSGNVLIHRNDRGLKDPILFDADSSDPPEQHSLFAEAKVLEAKPVDPTEALITKHMDMHMAQYRCKKYRPTREEYRLAVRLQSTVINAWKRDPAGYNKRLHEEWAEYKSAKRVCMGLSTQAAPVPIAPAPKGKRAIPIAPAPKGKRAISKALTPQKAPAQRVKRAPKTSPKAKLVSYPPTYRSETPERAAGAKREDVEYNSLPDYAPPISTLDAENAKKLKADWQSNNVLDLSNDPDRFMLHEDEIKVAGKLRLSCATYLCSKRRIFDGRLKALRNGKDFKKTDAQQACKIDVNKASKLHTAFQDVGWFDSRYFEEYHL